jgi:RNA polymerase sigma-70 factor (ECF subfamily)
MKSRTAGTDGKRPGQHALTAEGMGPVDDGPALAAPAPPVTAGRKPPPASGHPSSAEFEAIYRAHGDRMYTYLRARTPSRDEAADLTQQVFLQAMAAFPAFEDRGLPVTAWLFRIAHNVLTDSYRRHHQLVPWEALPEASQPADRFNLEDDAVLREQVRQVRRLVARLETSKQEVILLRFAGGLKVREIAQVLGRSESAIRTELSRTLRALKEMYDETR